MKLDSSKFSGILCLCIDPNGETASQLVHHIVVRMDIPIGNQVAQVVHASGESADPKPPPGTIAVALHARDEDHLLVLSAALDKAGIKHCHIIEDDGHLMAIGVNPTANRAAVRKVLSSLPLVR